MEPIYTLTDTPIVITDLDGTILVNGELKDDVISAFNKLQSMGIPVTFATGRSKVPASKYSKQLDLKIPYICSGGAIITDPESGLDIYKQEIEKKTYENIIKDVKKRKDLNIAVYCLEKIFIEDEFRWISDYCNRQRIELLKIENLKSIENRTVILLIGSIEATDKVSKDMKKKYKDTLEINKTFDNLCEISSKSGNKLNSSKVLLNLLNLTNDDLFYFGDGEADLDLLKYAKYGYTVEKSLANRKLNNLKSIKSPENNGFYKFLRSII